MATPSSAMILSNADTDAKNMPSGRSQAKRSASTVQTVSADAGHQQHRPLPLGDGRRIAEAHVVDEAAVQAGFAARMHDGNVPPARPARRYSFAVFCRSPLASRAIAACPAVIEAVRHAGACEQRRNERRRDPARRGRAAARCPGSSGLPRRAIERRQPFGAAHDAVGAVGSIICSRRRRRTGRRRFRRPSPNTAPQA